MPPKIKVTKEGIIKTAVEIVRERGVESLNARAIASALNCSTQPIFSNFTTMDELVREVMLDSYNRYLTFIQSEVKSEKYPKYKAFGMAYIRFAKDEKELFKLLFMCDRKGQELVHSPDFEESVQMIMSANGVSLETAQRMHFETWICVHGIATMIATSFLALDWSTVSDTLTDIYQGIRARHVSGGNNASN